MSKEFAGVRVEGLTELRLGLKAIGDGWPAKLGQLNKRVAQIVVDDARSKADTPQQRKAAESLKATAATTGATVTLGSGSPFALGAEFGALRYRQFPPWRGNQWNPAAGGVGYFLHPAIRDHLAEIEKTYLEAIDQLSKAAFPL